MNQPLSESPRGGQAARGLNQSGSTLAEIVDCENVNQPGVELFSFNHKRLNRRYVGFIMDESGHMRRVCVRWSHTIGDRFPYCEGRHWREGLERWYSTRRTLWVPVKKLTRVH